MPSIPLNLADGNFGSSLGDLFSSFIAWISQPHVAVIIVAWAVTFTAVCTLCMCLGFGPMGIGIGTLAAAFQSFMYGAFTPAGGIFATLTSMAMLGSFMPAVVAVASVVATAAAVVVWALGVGH